MKRLLIAVFLFAAVLALPSQGDFIQCVGGACAGTPNSDLINGSSLPDDIDAAAGDDIVFGSDGRDDELFGAEGADIIFGGLSSDAIDGGTGDDMILPGPDDIEDIQESLGNAGNDTFLVLVGETVNCQIIFGNEGFDIVQFIGFGPYVAESPYGQVGPVAIVIQDPVAGGYIFVLTGDGTDNVERITGLPSPNVTALDEGAFVTFRDQNCIQFG